MNKQSKIKLKNITDYSNIGIIPENSMISNNTTDNGQKHKKINLKNIGKVIKNKETKNTGKL